MKAASLALAALLALVSCQSAPAPIPADATAEIYFQRAQTASDLGQYDDALTIYQTFLTDKPDASHESTFSARYEIALLLAKKGKEAQAIADFESIVADYDNLEKSSGAPSWVKVLAQKKAAELKDKASKAKKAPAVSQP